MNIAPETTMIQSYRRRANASAFQIGGPLLEGALYASRGGDDEVIAALLAGQDCYVLGAPQTGKSSLRLRTQRRFQEMSGRASERGAAPRFHSIDVDLAAISAASTETEWFFTFACEIAARTNLEVELGALWSDLESLAPADRWKQFLLERVLPSVAGSGAEGALVLFLDNAQAVTELHGVASNFFRILRSLAEVKGRDRLRFCVFGTVIPSFLGGDANPESLPEDGWKLIELLDFTDDEARVLAEPFADLFGADNARLLLLEVLQWTSGHPYMTQRVCRELESIRRAELRAEEESGRKVEPDGKRELEQGFPHERVKQAVEEAFLNRPLFEEAPLLFAERYLFREHSDVLLEEMVKLYRQILGGGKVLSRPSSAAERHLRVAGLVVVRRDGRDSVLRVRNRIFAKAFDVGWLRENENELLLRAKTRRWRNTEATRKDDILLKDQPLSSILEWSRAHHELGLDENRFIQASLDKELGVAQRSRRRFRELAVVLGILVLLALAAVVAAAIMRARAAEALDSELRAKEEAERLRRASGQRSLEAQTRFTLLRGAPDMRLVRAAALRGLEFAEETQGGPGEVLAPALRLLAVAQNDHWGATILTDVASRRKGVVFEVELSPDGSRAATAGPGSEAGLWDVATGARIASLEGKHTKSIRETAFSQDGAVLVTVSEDGRSLLWNGRTGTFEGQLEQQGTPVTTVAASPAGDFLVTAGEDGVARLWDVRARKLLRALEPHKGPVIRVRFSEDGALFGVASEDGSARVWDTAGRKVATLGTAGNTGPRLGHTGAVRDLAISPDNARVATVSSDGTARLWDLGTVTQIATMRGHGTYVVTAAFSRDGERLATGGENNRILIWRAADGTFESSLEIEAGAVNRVAFSGDGKTLATASSDRHIRLWDVASGKLWVDLRGHEGAVADVVFASNDGSRLLTSGDDGTARLWQKGAETGPLQSLDGPRDYVVAVRHSADGSRLAAASDDGLAYVWDASGKLVSTLHGHVKPVGESVFFGGGKRVATGGEDGTARIWEAETGREQHVLKHDGAVTGLAVSADGETLVTGSKDGTVRAWSTSTGALSWQVEMAAPITAVAVSGKGHVAVGSSDGHLRVMDLRGGQDVASLATAKGHTDKIRGVAFSADGAKLVSASNDGTARIWRLDTGEGLSLEGHAHYVLGASFSSDGTRVLTYGWDGTARVWDAADGVLVSILAEDTQPVRSATFSPDGAWVAAGGLDGATRLWDAASGELLATFTSRVGDVWSVAFSPDGRRLAVGGRDGVVRVYAASTKGLIGAACRFVERTGRDEGVRELCDLNSNSQQ